VDVRSFISVAPSELSSATKWPPFGAVREESVAHVIAKSKKRSVESEETIVKTVTAR
jgi:hypothetical protein